MRRKVPAINGQVLWADARAGVYIGYVETDDVVALGARLKRNQACYADSDAGHPEVGLFVHPSALFGMLMGVSRTNFAWVWSGRPELAGPGANEIHRQD